MLNMIIFLSTKYDKNLITIFEKRSHYRDPHSNSEFVLAYLAVRLMPSALLEPSQLQLPPQPEDFRARLGATATTATATFTRHLFVKFITDIS